MSTAQKRPQSPTARRVASYRQRMREAGYVQRAIWVHDTRSADYAAEARRQSIAVAADDPAGDEVMAWLDDVRAWPEA